MLKYIPISLVSIGILFGGIYIGECHHNNSDSKNVKVSSNYSSLERDDSEFYNRDVFSLPKNKTIKTAHSYEISNNPNFMRLYMDGLKSVIRYGIANYDSSIINSDGTIEPYVFGSDAYDNKAYVGDDAPLSIHVIKENEAYALADVDYIHRDGNGYHEKKDVMLLPKRLERHIIADIKSGDDVKLNVSDRTPSEYTHVMTPDETKTHIQEILNAK